MARAIQLCSRVWVGKGIGGRRKQEEVRRKETEDGVLFRNSSCFSSLFRYFSWTWEINGMDPPFIPGWPSNLADASEAVAGIKGEEDC